MLTDRGEHRAIYTVLVQSPEFLQLSPAAQLAWFHLKLLLGPTGLGVLMAPEATLAETTGLPPNIVAAALAELEGQDVNGMGDAIPDGMGNGIPHPIWVPSRGGGDDRFDPWLRRQKSVLWLRNALRFEPSRSLDNSNHRKSIEKYLATLPKLRIVNDFARYYGLTLPFPESAVSNGMGDPIRNGIGRAYPITEHGERRTEDGERNTETEASARARAREGTLVDPDCVCEFNEPCPVPGHKTVHDEPDAFPRWSVLDIEARSTVDRPSRAVSETEHEPDAFARWMGDEAERLGPLSPITRLALSGLYGPNGTDEAVWKAVPEDDRPRLLATAILRWQGESHPAFKSRLFRAILQTVIAEGGGRSGRDPGIPPDPLTGAQHSLYLEIRAALEECGMDPEQAADEAMKQAREAS